jgi:hypothetical protein
MPGVITAERPDTPESRLLIAELQTHLESFYPPESRHGFSVQKLIDQQVAFFVLRADDRSGGCATSHIRPPRPADNPSGKASHGA